MIEIPTVLVLGAGASMPFGFPSGQTLVDIICYFLCPGKDPNYSLGAQWPDNSINETNRLLKSVFDPRDIDTFAEHLDGEESIDAFLEHQEGEFVDIGKAAIVATLLPFEREQSLFNDFATRRLVKAFLGEEDPVGAVNNWYQLLGGALEAPSFEKLQDNNLRVITFNYDRSLEHYLFTRLKRRYPGKEDQEYFAKMPQIAHIHGQLGYLPWQSEADCNNQVPYDAMKLARELKQEVSNAGPRLQSMTKQYFDRARKRIKVIHEAGGETDELEMARKWIGGCERLYFLGFGYHKSNVERLQIPDLYGRRGELIGTTYGLSLKNNDYVYDLFCCKSELQRARRMRSVDVYEFLHDKVDLTLGSDRR